MGNLVKPPFDLVNTFVLSIQPPILYLYRIGYRLPASILY